MFKENIETLKGKLADVDALIAAELTARIKVHEVGFAFNEQYVKTFEERMLRDANIASSNERLAAAMEKIATALTTEVSSWKDKVEGEVAAATAPSASLPSFSISDALDLITAVRQEWAESQKKVDDRAERTTAAIEMQARALTDFASSVTSLVQLYRDYGNPCVRQ